MSVLLPITAGTLPPGVCYSSEQARLAAFSSHMQAVLNVATYYNFGPDKPAPQYQAYPWFRTTDGRWYYFENEWRSPVNYDPNERRLYIGDLTSLETYDGGSAGIVSPTTGPMWEEDEDFRGRSPMGPGEIPDFDPAVTLNVATDYGEGRHTQTIDELVEHTHGPKDGYDDFTGFVSAGQPSSYEATGGTELNRMNVTGPSGGGEPMPVVHPVRGLYIVKWTGRLYRIIP